MAFYASPIVAGSAIGQLFGRPLFGVVAVVASLLCAANLVESIGYADSESLRHYLIAIGAMAAWPITLAVIRRCNARHDA